MKAQGLRELTDGFAHRAVADRAPRTWQEAVAAYAEDRRATLKRDWPVLADFDADKRRLEVAAVGMIEKRLVDNVAERFTLKLDPRDEREATQNKIDLAALLCPTGWQEQYAAVLKTLAAEVEASWLEGKNIKDAQAVAREVQEFERFLLQTEAEGRKAVAEQMRPTRASGARDPRAVMVGARAAM